MICLTSVPAFWTISRFRPSILECSVRFQLTYLRIELFTVWNRAFLINTNRSKEWVTNKKKLACVGERKAGTVLCLRLYPFLLSPAAWNRAATAVFATSVVLWFQIVLYCVLCHALIFLLDECFFSCRHCGLTMLSSFFRCKTEAWSF